ncbi:MAG: DUF2318 domain-containing protein [Candidatus Altiarchaeota archaeon]
MEKNRSKKKEKFEERQRTQGLKISGTHIIGVLIVLAAVFMIFGSGSQTKAEDITNLQLVASSEGGSSAGTGNQADPESFYIPISKINDGIAHFYEYPSSTGKTIRFFVLKSKDGIIRAAFDACDVCFREGKGYRQEGDFMVCNNCGQRFASDKINEIKGGCNPAPLDRHVENNAYETIALANPPGDAYLVIEKSDIEGGVGYF